MMEHMTSIDKTTSVTVTIPSYNQPKTYTYGKNAPPQYERLSDKKAPESSNLFQSIEHARNGAYNACDILRKFGTLFCCSVSIIVILLILMAIPVTMITIGVLNIPNCRIQNLIPIWLIVAGGASILKNVLTLLQRIKALKNEKASSNTVINVIDSIIALFLLVWFIIGNVWVYRVAKTVQYSDVSLDNYCERFTYQLSFWVITGIYILAGLSCLLFCCTVCFTIFISPKK